MSGGWVVHVGHGFGREEEDQLSRDRFVSEVLTSQGEGRCRSEGDVPQAPEREGRGRREGARANV